MKTIACSTVVVAVALAVGTRSADASDLSQMFRALEAAQHTSAPAATPTMQPPAPAAPRLLLGAWLTDSEGRLQVSATVPGTPASQTLQPGDVLCRIGAAGGRTLSLRTLHQFEYAKREIGPYRPCLLDVYRPGVGMLPLTVTFETDGRVAAVAPASQAPAAVPVADPVEGLVGR